MRASPRVPKKILPKNWFSNLYKIYWETKISCNSNNSPKLDTKTSYYPDLPDLLIAGQHLVGWFGNATADAAERAASVAPLRGAENSPVTCLTTASSSSSSGCSLPPAPLVLPACWRARSGGVWPPRAGRRGPGTTCKQIRTITKKNELRFVTRSG